MRALVCALSLVSIFFSACAHVTTVEHPYDEVLDSFQKTSEPKGVKTVLADCKESSDTRLFCSFRIKDRCDVSDIDLTAHYVTYENSTSHWVKVLEWVATGAVFGIGLAVTIDAGNLPDGSDPLDSNPVGQAGAYAIGGGLLAASAGLGTWATLDSLRALDETKEVGREEIARKVEEVDCEEQALADTELEIHSAKTFAKVRTDAQGQVTVALDKLIPYEVAADPATPTSYQFKRDGKVCFEGRAERYFAAVREKERKRLAKLETQRKEIEETNRIIEAMLTEGQGATCLHWWDDNAEIREDPRTYPRIPEVRACVMQGLAEHCRMAFGNGDLDKGALAIDRLKEMDSTHEALPGLARLQKSALAKDFDESLRTFRLGDAKKSLTQCHDRYLSDPVCGGMQRRWELSSVLLGLQSDDAKLRSGLVVVFQGRKQAKKNIGKLSKRFVLQSGGIKDLEWVSADKIAAVFPDDDPRWQQKCLADDSCAVGVLKQLEASFLLALEIDGRKQKSHLKVSLIQPVGGLLDRQQQEHEGLLSAILKDMWSKVEDLILVAKTNAAQARKDRLLAQQRAKEETAEQAAAAAARKAAGAASDQAAGGDERIPAAYRAVDLQGVFATDDDMPAPANCIDLGKAAELAGGEQGAVFKKPRVLLLDLTGIAEQKAQMDDAFLGVQALKRTFMNNLRMKRNIYIQPCKPVSLGEIKNQPLPGVEFVFAIHLDKWEEERNEKTGKVEGVKTAFTLEIWDVRDGGWKAYGEHSLEVPSWLDRGVFLAEDKKREAVDQAIASADGAVNSAVGGVTSKPAAKLAMAAADVDESDTHVDVKGMVNGGIDAMRQAAGAVKIVRLEDKQKDWYVHKAKQSVIMAAKKLGVEVAGHPEFRLVSPVLAREDDEVGVGVGDSEGVALSDTFLFSSKGPEDWEGFGRVSRLGPGGGAGAKDPSMVEVIADYDSAEDEIQVMEYPLVGIITGFSTGLLPFSHGAYDFPGGESVDENSVGMVGLSFEVKWRIPWLPICELYQTNRINYIFDIPVVLLTIDPGFEKRWFWGRFAPLVGLRYSLGIAGVPNGDETATATTHGLEFYTGFNLFLHPVVTLALQTGWRQYFATMNSFESDSGVLNTGDWKLDLSGFFALLGITYEF